MQTKVYKIATKHCVWIQNMLRSVVYTENSAIIKENGRGRWFEKERDWEEGRRVGSPCGSPEENDAGRGKKSGRVAGRDFGKTSKGNSKCNFGYKIVRIWEAVCGCRLPLSVWQSLGCELWYRKN